MKIAVVKNTPDNIFAVFGDDITHYNKPPTDLREKLYSSNLIKQKNYGGVFITTYLSSKQKSCGSKNSPDIENILLFNLRQYEPINNLISIANKIIIQGMDNVKNWPQPNYLHYYFYGVFNNQKCNEYLLYDCKYDCKCQNKFSLKYQDYESLRDAPSKTEGEKGKKLTEICDKYERPSDSIVKSGQKFCLMIEINQNYFPKSIDNDSDKKNSIKKLIDTIIIFANKLNIIKHSNTNELIVSKNGDQYNPNDDLLYYCEIEKVDNKETKDDIIFCVFPICDKNKDNCYCEEKQDSVKSFPGFRKGDEIEFFSE